MLTPVARGDDRSGEQWFSSQLYAAHEPEEEQFTWKLQFRPEELPWRPEEFIFMMGLDTASVVSQGERCG